MKSTIKSTIVWVCLIMGITLFAACGKNKCEEPYDVMLSAIVLIFKNSTGDYLYREVNPIFEKDSLKVFDEFGSRMSTASQLNQIPNTASSYWEFDFGPIYNSVSDAGAFNSELCKKFIIKYYHNQADTITTCFKALKFDCGSEFCSLKVFHKGVLLSEVNNHIVATVTIAKN